MRREHDMGKVEPRSLVQKGGTLGTKQVPITGDGICFYYCIGTGLGRGTDKGLSIHNDIVAMATHQEDAVAHASDFEEEKRRTSSRTSATLFATWQMTTSEQLLSALSFGLSAAMCNPEMMARSNILPFFGLLRRQSCHFYYNAKSVTR